MRKYQTATDREATRYGVLPSTLSFQIREPGSALTHFFGLILLLTGTGPLMMRARLSGSGLTCFSMAVFLLTACLLYAASTLYHTVVLDRQKTNIFRKIDHSMISVMIGGSYTPFCLLVLKGRTGLVLLLMIWGLALLGMALKFLWITCPKWLSSALYLLMGWACLFCVRPLYLKLPSSAFLWLLSGGLAYSAGALIYAMKLRVFNEKHRCFGSHEIFHVFIMIGTFCHYMVMFRTLAYFR